MTIETTKIEPRAMPDLHIGRTIRRTTSNFDAPASTAASISFLSMRAIELKIGTIMKIVSWWT